MMEVSATAVSKHQPNSAKHCFDQSQTPWQCACVMIKESPPLQNTPWISWVGLQTSNLFLNKTFLLSCLHTFPLARLSVQGAQHLGCFQKQNIPFVDVPVRCPPNIHQVWSKVIRYSFFFPICANFSHRLHYKDLRFPHPSTMQSPLDRKATDNICRKYNSLRHELEALERRYAAHSSEARNCEMLLRKTRERLDYLTQNIDQVFCDELDQLSVEFSYDSQNLSENQDVPTRLG